MDNYQYSFEKLDVWKNARLFVIDIYKLNEKIKTITKQLNALKNSQTKRLNQ